MPHVFFGFAPFGPILFITIGKLLLCRACSCAHQKVKQHPCGKCPSTPHLLKIGYYSRFVFLLHMHIIVIIRVISWMIIIVNRFLQMTIISNSSFFNRTVYSASKVGLISSQSLCCASAAMVTWHFQADIFIDPSSGQLKFFSFPVTCLLEKKEFVLAGIMFRLNWI